MKPLLIALFLVTASSQRRLRLKPAKVFGCEEQNSPRPSCTEEEWIKEFEGGAEGECDSPIDRDLLLDWCNDDETACTNWCKGGLKESD
jgi:hypothetical protein